MNYTESKVSDHFHRMGLGSDHGLIQLVPSILPMNQWTPTALVSLTHSCGSASAKEVYLLHNRLGKILK